MVAPMNGGTHWAPMSYPGAIWLYPGSTPPNTAWAVCDGSTFDTTEYAGLAQLLPDGVLPDLTAYAPDGTSYIILLGPASS